MATLTEFFSASRYMPHGHCYFWEPKLVWAMVTSDLLIGISYLSIAFSLYGLIRKIRIPFSTTFLAFGAFIAACGATHFMEVWTLWHPTYWVSASIKAVTAAASVFTAAWLYPLRPKVIQLAHDARSSEKNRLELVKTNLQLASAVEELSAKQAEVTELVAKLQNTDRLKSQMFANVSHELRTPLALILGPLSQLASAGNLTDEQKEELAIADRNARTLLGTVNDLLDIAKLEAGKFQPLYSSTDLAQLAQQVCSRFRSLSGQLDLRLSVNTPPELKLESDSNMMEKILLNLVANAFKFTPRGGEIEVRLQMDGDDAWLRISDSGPGIPSNLRSSVFDRFRQLDGSTTRSFGGTGLGLAIVKDFVQLLGGEVSISDGHQGGCLVGVRIPLRAPQGTVVRPGVESERLLLNADLAVAALETHLPQPADAAQFELDDKRPLVLIVEDRPDMQHFLRQIFNPRYRILTAQNGQEGLRLTVQNRPDLILTDVMMPVLSGDQMVEWILRDEELKTIPIVLLTAKNDEKLRLRLLQMGARDFVVKPFHPEELLTRVHNLITMKMTKDVLSTEDSSASADVVSLASQMKELTVALKRALRSRDEFLSLASHELKTPLTSAYLQMQILDRRIDMGGKHIPTADELKSAYSLCLRQLNSMAALIDDLLDVSKIQLGKWSFQFAEVNLATLLQDVVSRYRDTLNRAGVALELSVPSNIVGMWDQHRIEQIFVNLLSNIIKYAPGKPARISAVQRGVFAEVEICDNGQGVPQEIQKKLFDRFERAAPRNVSGLGLGLYIIKGILDSHRGSIRIHSTPGSGACFLITLPLHATSELLDRQSGAGYGQDKQEVNSDGY
jgi:signal transduction histidine kinase